MKSRIRSLQCTEVNAIALTSMAGLRLTRTRISPADADYVGTVATRLRRWAACSEVTTRPPCASTYRSYMFLSGFFFLSAFFLASARAHFAALDEGFLPFCACFFFSASNAALRALSSIGPSSASSSACSCVTGASSATFLALASSFFSSFTSSLVSSLLSSLFSFFFRLLEEVASCGCCWAAKSIPNSARTSSMSSSALAGCCFLSFFGFAASLASASFLESDSFAFTGFCCPLSFLGDSSSDPSLSVSESETGRKMASSSSSEASAHELTVGPWLTCWIRS
mmetsp:Transcript_58953/g.164738  ORF Transcript_58953/g.164738 Transcript_58953/m.164738 type:complete len:283 (+) Transcript_58953:35-883(+)